MNWLELFGRLGDYPKVSKCKHYEPEKYEKAQRGEWNCLFWEDGECGYEPDPEMEEDKDFKFDREGNIICPDKDG